jgi:hypothetical protein
VSCNSSTHHQKFKVGTTVKIGNVIGNAPLKFTKNALTGTPGEATSRTVLKCGNQLEAASIVQ